MHEHVAKRARWRYKLQAYAYSGTVRPDKSVALESRGLQTETEATE